MKKYLGHINHIEGRGDVLITKIPQSDKLPRIGSFIMVHGHKFKVRDVECAKHGDGTRAEMVGILLHADKCSRCGK